MNLWKFYEKKKLKIQWTPKLPILGIDIYLHLEGLYNTGYYYY